MVDSHMPQPANPSKKYQPGMSGGMGGGALAYVLDNKPWFTYWDIPRLQRDPYINFLRTIWISPLQQVTWSVRANSQETADTVHKSLFKFWKKFMPSIMRRYFLWGYAPGGVEYRVKDDRWQLDQVRAIEPHDARVLVASGGPEKGEFAGFQTNTTEKILRPYAFWFAGRGEFGRFYDQPPAANLFDAWTEYGSRGGARHLRQLYMRKHSISPAVAYFKPGETTWADPVNGQTKTIDNKTLALMTLEAYEAGSNLAVAAEFDENGNRLWEIVPAQVGTDAENVSHYPDKLKKEMAEACGIPFEAIEAAETGSGYSGRSVPYRAWLGVMDEYAGLLVDSFDNAPLRQLVRVNHGKKADYEIVLKSLVTQFAEEGKQEGGAARGAAKPQPESPTTQNPIRIARDDAGGDGFSDDRRAFSMGHGEREEHRGAIDPVVFERAKRFLESGSYEMGQGGTAHAPKGGIILGGKQFVGGEFIPGDVLAKASAEEKNKLLVKPAPTEAKKPDTVVPNPVADKYIAQAQAIVKGKITPTKQRAFDGKQSGKPIDIHLAGAIGEEIIIAHLKSIGYDDADYTSSFIGSDNNNIAFDLIHDHQLVEAKTGQTSNANGVWALKYDGRFNKIQEANFAKMTPENMAKAKKKINAAKVKAIHDRKQAFADAMQKKLGYKIKTGMITVIINHDTKTADLYQFDGLHDRIGWNSELAKSAYLKSVKYG